MRGSNPKIESGSRQFSNAHLLRGESNSLSTGTRLRVKGRKNNQILSRHDAAFDNTTSD